VPLNKRKDLLSNKGEKALLSKSISNGSSIPEIERYFERELHYSPSRISVIRTLIDNSVSVKEGRLYINEIRISVQSIAQAANVDTRVVKKTIRDIESISRMKRFFNQLRSEGPSPKSIGLLMYLNVLEISFRSSEKTITDLVVNIARLFAAKKSLIRSFFAIDSQLSLDPRIIIVAEDFAVDLPRELLAIKGIKSVNILARESDLEAV